jgi:hypothetical protein
MIKNIILSALIIIITSVSLNAQEKMTIAVLDLKAKGTSKIVAGVVADLIRSEMIKTGLFTVIERTQMNEILREQNFQMTGCVDQACAVQIGKLLSARKVLVGELGMMGKTFVITVRIVDVEKGSSEFAANEKANNEEALTVASESITKNLSQNIMDGNPDIFISRITPTGYYIRGIVPGWPQIYAGHETKGAVYLTAFAGTMGFLGYSLYNMFDKKKAYEDQKPPQSEIDAKYDKYRNATNMALYAGITLGAVYMAHWADMIFFSKPKFGAERKNAGIAADREAGLSFAAVRFSDDVKETHYTLGYMIRF